VKAVLIAVGERAPDWVASGFSEYQKRLSHWLPLALVEVAPGMRGKGRDVARATSDEGVRVLAALPKQAHVICLDGRGKALSSEQLAQRLEAWRQSGRDLAFLIGGPEGHAPEVLAAAHETWSLGPLTLPHMLVRLVLAEQLYRACSLLANHPYHRA
jgi:23S rRNA (pseudouridine1915-N3)-methyltransferase